MDIQDIIFILWITIKKTLSVSSFLSDVSPLSNLISFHCDFLFYENQTQSFHCEFFFFFLNENKISLRFSLTDCKIIEVHIKVVIPTWFFCKTNTCTVLLG